VPYYISLDSPRGSNRLVKGLLKGIGGVGVGVSGGEGMGGLGGVLVMFSFPVGIKLAISEAKTLWIPISSASMMDNVITHMFISFLTRLT
jgi:hypothetical protein